MKTKLIRGLVGTVLGLTFISACTLGDKPQESIFMNHNGMRLEVIARKSNPDRVAFWIADVSKGDYMPGKNPFIYAVDCDWKPEMPKHYEEFDFDVIKILETPENHPFNRYNENEIRNIYYAYRANLEKDDIGIGY